MAGADKNPATKGGLATGAMIAGVVGLLALPSAVLAVTAGFKASSEQSLAASLTSSAAPSALARPIPVRSLAEGQIYPFTPAGTPNRPNRSITVAVRVNPETVEAISVHGQRVQNRPEAGSGELRIAPTAFNLGMSRGYKNFTQPLVQTSGSKPAGIPDLRKFSIAKSNGSDESRFSPRIVLDEAQAAGRAPRTFTGEGENRVDVGGSYRVTDNLDVTAGVRYKEERERLLPPLTDGKQDSQAVYVGTQFRF